MFKCLVLALVLLLSPKATSIQYWDHEKCENVLEFVGSLVGTDDRNRLVENWRIIVTYQLRKRAISRVQFNARKLEIQAAIKIVKKLESKGYTGDKIVRLAAFKCST